MTRLLALIPGGISKQLLCFPMLESLQQQYPQAQIDVVVEPLAKPAYRVSRVVQQVLAYDFQGRTGPADWGNLIGWVREREYDALICLDPARLGGLLLWLVGVPKRVGFAKVPSALFMTDTIPCNPQQYAAHMYHDLLKPMGIKQACPPLAIAVSPDDLKWAEAERQRLGLGADQGYILLHGGSMTNHAALGPGSVYPQSNWQALAKGLLDRQPNVPVVLVQLPSDRPWFTPIATGCPGLKVSTPDNLGRMAAMIAAANLVICTDSDAMHLTVALGNYLFVLFGATDATKVLPQNDRIVTLRSTTGKVADIPPIQMLEKIWGR